MLLPGWNAGELSSLQGNAKGIDGLLQALFWTMQGYWNGTNRQKGIEWRIIRQTQTLDELRKVMDKKTA